MSTPSPAFRKPADLDDLRALAFDVYVGVGAPVQRSPLDYPGEARMSALDAAQALAGPAAWIGRFRGPVRMREVMAELVRHTEAWRAVPRPFGNLPLLVCGRVDADVLLLACFASGLVKAYGLEHLRAAMAYWAIEADPASWQRVVEA